MHVVKAREIGHMNELHFYNTIAATVAFTMLNSECASSYVSPSQNNLVDRNHDLLLEKSRYL